MVTLEQQMADSPSWMTPAGKAILTGLNYTLAGETINEAYTRVAKAAATALFDAKFNTVGTQVASAQIEQMAAKFEDYMKRGLLCPATPVLANMGTDRGLPISCFGGHVADTFPSICAATTQETAMLSQGGGGVAMEFSSVRSAGSPIRGIGRSRGIIPFVRWMDATTQVADQGEVRSAATVAWLNIEHGDAMPFMDIRRRTGDPMSRTQKINHGVMIPDSYMQRVAARDPSVKESWLHLMTTRAELGEPYIGFLDNINKANPQWYKDRGLMVESSNLCCEISLVCNEDWTFVCCLSSLNVAQYDSWPPDLVETAIFFLDGVMSEFIRKAEGKPGFDRAVAFAKANRALGLGVSGYHTYLQSKMLPFASMMSNAINKKIFSRMREEADAATNKLAKMFGECDVCVGYSRRNTHTLAVAPTRTLSTYSGQQSFGIEPITANSYVDNSAGPSFEVRNHNLERVLGQYGQNTPETWASIMDASTANGSVQHLSFLSGDEKAVFKTAREIDQVDIVLQAADRQKYIDQAQSLNLFFPANCDPKYFVGVHKLAWEVGVKSLYYTKGKSVLTADAAAINRYKVPTIEELKECRWCQ